MQRSWDTGCVNDPNPLFEAVGIELTTPQRWLCGDGPPYQISMEMRITNAATGGTWTEQHTGMHSC